MGRVPLPRARHRVPYGRARGFARVDALPPPSAAPSHPGGGPWGGSVTRLVADDPSSASPALWAATRGGVYYSAPGSNGGSWEARNSGLQSLDVRDLAVGPGSTGSRTMLAATYDKGVYLSRNSGLSWTRLVTSAACFTAVAVDPANANRFFASAVSNETESRTYYSTNGGSSWSVLRDAYGFDITAQVNRMVFSRDGSSTLFIGSGTGFNGRVYRLRPADTGATLLTPDNLLSPVTVYGGGQVATAVTDIALPDPAGGTALVLAAAGPRGVWAGSADAGAGGSDSTGGDPRTYSATLFYDHAAYPQGGPEVTVKPNDYIVLSAVVEDALGGQPITGAEYFFNTTGAGGTGIAMSGGFGASVAAVSADITPTTSWAPGRHTLYIHGSTAAGWGPFATVTLNLWREYHFPSSGANLNAHRVTAVSRDPAHPNRMLYYLYDGDGMTNATRLYEIPDIRAAATVNPPINPVIALPEEEMRVRTLLVTAGREFMGETMAGVFVRYNSSGTFSHKSKGMTAYDATGFDYQPSGAGGSLGDAGLAVTGGGTEVGNGSGGFNRWVPGQGWVRQAGGTGRFDPGAATFLVRYEGESAVWLSVSGFGLYRGVAPDWAWTPRSDGVSQTALNDVSGLAVGAPDAAQNRAIVMSASQGVYKAVKDVNNNDLWQEVLGDPASLGWRTASDPVDPVSAFYSVVGNTPVGEGLTGTALYHSSDKGATWAQIFGEPILFFRSFAAAPDDSGQLLAGDSYYGLFESLDGGVSWTSASDPANPSGLPVGSVSSVDIRRWPGGAVAKAVFFNNYSNRGVYLSGDDGRTWTLHTAGIDGVLGAPYVHHLSFTPDGRGVVVAVRNRGLWSVAIGAPPVSAPSKTDPSSPKQSSPLPSPPLTTSPSPLPPTRFQQTPLSTERPSAGRRL